MAAKRFRTRKIVRSAAIRSGMILGGAGLIGTGITSMATNGMGHGLVGSGATLILHAFAPRAITRDYLKKAGLSSAAVGAGMELMNLDGSSLLGLVGAGLGMGFGIYNMTSKPASASLSPRKAERYRKELRKLAGLSRRSRFSDHSLRTPEVKKAIATITTHLQEAHSHEADDILPLAGGMLCLTRFGNVRSLGQTRTFGDVIVGSLKLGPLANHEIRAADVVAEIVAHARRIEAGESVPLLTKRNNVKNYTDNNDWDSGAQINAAMSLPLDKAKHYSAERRKIVGLSGRWSSDRSLRTPEVERAIATITAHLRANKKKKAGEILSLSNGNVGLTRFGKFRSIGLTKTFQDNLLGRLKNRRIAKHEINASHVVDELLANAARIEAGKSVPLLTKRNNTNNYFDSRTIW
jgi:hypothetical protein